MDDAGWIAEATGATGVRVVERIQALWGGYGELDRVVLEGSPSVPAVVKSARVPRGVEPTFAHRRKCRSYDVELAFYREHAAGCPARIARLLASRSAKDRWTLVLEDLDAAGFARRDDDPAPRELDACLEWLASFHAHFLGAPPTGLWEEGTYWHLATRPDELAAIGDPTLRAAAPMLDARLRDTKHRTLVHGDAKEANFCFAEDGAVAAVDFQYVGGGCGMRDVAYLLGGRPSAIAESVEAWGLDVYFGHLRARLGNRASAIEAEWRALYPVAWLDFQRFLAGWSKARWESDRATRSRVRTLLATLG